MSGPEVKTMIAWGTRSGAHPACSLAGVVRKVSVVSGARMLLAPWLVEASTGGAHAARGHLIVAYGPSTMHGAAYALLPCPAHHHTLSSPSICSWQQQSTLQHFALLHARLGLGN